MSKYYQPLAIIKPFWYSIPEEITKESIIFTTRISTGEELIVYDPGIKMKEEKINGKIRSENVPDRKMS